MNILIEMLNQKLSKYGEKIPTKASEYLIEEISQLDTYFLPNDSCKINVDDNKISWVTPDGFNHSVTYCETDESNHEFRPKIKFSLVFECEILSPNGTKEKQFTEKGAEILVKNPEIKNSGGLFQLFTYKTTHNSEYIPDSQTYSDLNHGFFPGGNLKDIVSSRTSYTTDGGFLNGKRRKLKDRKFKPEFYPDRNHILTWEEWDPIREDIANARYVKEFSSIYNPIHNDLGEIIKRTAGKRIDPIITQALTRLYDSIGLDDVLRYVRGSLSNYNFNIDRLETEEYVFNGEYCKTVPKDGKLVRVIDTKISKCYGRFDWKTIDGNRNALGKKKNA